MRRLRLFTVFHANLDFSAIPEAAVPQVIASCYWPLLSLAAEARLPVGLELTARTLARVNEEDPEWVKTLRSLIERGLVECVGSGLAQVIGPLVPADVNRANLEAGHRSYVDQLGQAPTTWFVNEQTWSDGLADLYADVGARSLVMEWNNAASWRQELRPLRYRAAQLATKEGRLDLLWNDCVIFQKLQRVAHGEIPAWEYLEAVAGAHTGDAGQRLCAYGGDLEIFDYRPGRPAPSGSEAGVEMRRLGDSLRALAADERFTFVLPGSLREDSEAGPLVRLSSAREPIPCKKQPRYNPTRWAVCGRDGLGMNTRCFSLRRDLRAAFGQSELQEEDAAALATLWGSDFRTRATEEKIEYFESLMAARTARARSALSRRVPLLSEGEDALVVNTWDVPWRRDPIELPLRLPPGRLHHAAVRAEPSQALAEDAVQVEVHSRYRDGSLRELVLVLEPNLDPGERLGIRLVPDREGDGPARGPLEGDRLETSAVEAAFLPHRGGALHWARFPGVDPTPLVGTLPHGSFQHIAYTPDFYTGHVVATTDRGAKVTDLSRCDAPRVVQSGPIRTSVVFRGRGPLGVWAKLYRLYARRPRLDLVHTLNLQEARLRSLRLGLVTWLPDAFERESLGFATVNGGVTVEAQPFGPLPISQHQPVSSAVSASSCLGATEGWVSAGDARRGLAVIGDRAEAALAPLLEFADVDDRFFLRLHHSAAESDETSVTFFRGVRRFAVTLLAHRNDLADVRHVARAVERGLAYRTETDLGIARGL